MNFLRILLLRIHEYLYFKQESLNPNLQRQNDHVTSRVLEVALIPFCWDINGPHGFCKKFLSMIAHQTHRQLKNFLLKYGNCKTN